MYRKIKLETPIINKTRNVSNIHLKMLERMVYSEIRKR